MARFWSGEIGGIELLDLDGEVAGFELAGAGAFKDAAFWTGNTTPGARGYPHTQYIQNLYNKTIELRFIHIPQTLAAALEALLIPLIPSGSGVICSFTDGFDTITGTFKPKMPTSQFIERGLPDGDYINDYILRLINRPPM